MDRLTLLGCLALPLAMACTSGGSASPAGTSSSSSPQSTTPSTGPSPGAPASTVPTAAGPRLATTPVVGTPCNPGADSVGCGPGGLEELTCAGSVWRQLQTCRGPGKCTGVGSPTRCDFGTLQLGDACVGGGAPARCSAPRTLQSCVSGKWAEATCPGTATCRPGAGNAPASCGS